MTARRTPELIHIGHEDGIRLDVEYIPAGTPIKGFEDLGLVMEADQYILWEDHSGMDISQASFEATKAALQRQQ